MDDKEFKKLMEALKSLPQKLDKTLRASGLEGADPLGLKTSMDQRMGAAEGAPPPQMTPPGGGNLGGGQLPPNPEQLAAMLRGR